MTKVPDFVFTHNCSNDGIEKFYPDNLKVEISFNHEGHIQPVIYAFRDFLRGCGWADVTIDQYLDLE